jgi:hypothetical protein
MHDEKGIRQAKCTVRKGWGYTIAHDQSRRELKPIVKSAANMWSMTRAMERWPWGRE